MMTTVKQKTQTMIQDCLAASAVLGCLKLISMLNGRTRFIQVSPITFSTIGIGSIKSAMGAFIGRSIYDCFDKKEDNMYHRAAQAALIASGVIGFSVSSGVVSHTYLNNIVPWTRLTDLIGTSVGIVSADILKNRFYPNKDSTESTGTMQQNNPPTFGSTPTESVGTNGNNQSINPDDT